MGALLTLSLVALLVYAGLLALTYWEFRRAPTGFIPDQDGGYLMLTVQLPDSASVLRTEKVIAHIDKLARATPGVAHTVGVSGQSLILNANAPNLGSMYVLLKPFDERSGPGLGAAARLSLTRLTRMSLRRHVVLPGCTACRYAPHSRRRTSRIGRPPHLDQTVTAARGRSMTCLHRQASRPRTLLR